MIMRVFFANIGCVALSLGDAPYCTPEQYKECADPALGEKLASSVETFQSRGQFSSLNPSAPHY